eukprot:GEMP01027961.1.p1 GENE.GEMP01027961.1~~GEMP01027961.1.p1  ORF type:complete len:315 (+),score=75.76 GEMP01027961.1:80-1024(+)
MPLSGMGSCSDDKALTTLTESLARELSRELIRQQELVNALCQARADAMDLTSLLGKPDDEDFALPLNEVNISCSPSPARDSHMSVAPPRLNPIRHSGSNTAARKVPLGACGDETTVANALLGVDDLCSPEQGAAGEGDGWHSEEGNSSHQSLLNWPAAQRRLYIGSEEAMASENDDDHSAQVSSPLHSLAASRQCSASASSLIYTGMNPLTSYTMTDGGTVNQLPPPFESTSPNASHLSPIDPRPIRDIPPEKSPVSAINRVLPLPRPLQEIDGQPSEAQNVTCLPRESENKTDKLWHRPQQGVIGLLRCCNAV